MASVMNLPFIELYVSMEKALFEISIELLAKGISMKESSAFRFAGFQNIASVEVALIRKLPAKDLERGVALRTTRRVRRTSTMIIFFTFPPIVPS
jgi:thermostable 8-oxoguanine DNA glycosylase